MEHVNILREYGLFDAKVPRYTSYPPANRFELNTGVRVQADWLMQVPSDEPISVYLHIPFCRRLCWFCACRTQGTKTMQPVDAYVDELVAEIRNVAGYLTTGQKMARLHLGGGTPTLLNPAQMDKLLTTIDRYFGRTADFEFSVEIDPTEAAPEILQCLAERGMNRASIGVQDFEPQVQEAIGRRQSFGETRAAVAILRNLGVRSLNVDLLYGLPYQTLDTLQNTLMQVQALQPDRLALYGYAHVPHMSKRQVMIPNEALPSTLDRFHASHSARQMLTEAGYEAIGIDHFSKASDGLAKAARAHRLKRNFQGYTDDPCNTLIGFGASAISKFPRGYIQNAVATAAYESRVREGRLAGHKGYEMRQEEFVTSDIVDQIMCYSHIDTVELFANHAGFEKDIQRVLDDLVRVYPKALEHNGRTINLRPGMEAMARVLAAHVDTALQTQHLHSAAI